MNLSNCNTIRTNDDWLVWRGQNPVDRQMYLVKEAKRTSPYRPHLIARLTDEYRFLDQFNHPHLLRPVSLDPTSGRAVFADAQCNLTQYLREHGPLSATMTANVLVMAAEALDHLHARGFLHGSVGAAGLFVTPAGRVAFADFHGHPFKSTNPVPVPNTEPQYLAPELIDATVWGTISPSADLYCLGFLALELLCGPAKFPDLFGVADGADWLKWHSNADRKLVDWKAALRDTPAGLVEVIDGLIAKRPTDREFQTAAHLKEFLVRSRLTSDETLPCYGRRARGGTVAIQPPPVRQRTGQLPRKVSRKPRLVLHPLDKVGQPWSLRPAKAALLGRGRGCDVPCRGKAVSPKHALVLCGQDGVWRVYDISSAHATFVNGRPMRRSTLLPDDELYLGECGFRVELDAAAGARRFDEFELVAKLHHGGRGTVYRGKWLTRSGREVAVRVFPKRFQFDATGLKRLLRGVPELAQVRHPNLVPVYRAGAERVGRYRAWFVATEYMPGGSLRDRLAGEKRLPTAEAVAAVAGAAGGAKAVAARGLVHRVINPGCVFPGPAGAKLGDFFFARPLNTPPGQEVTAFVGHELNDLVYQAPECVAGRPDLTPACDVYSLGATLYEALTGHPPVDPTGPLPAACERILAGSIVPVRERASGVPAAVAAVVGRALKTNPADRYADAGEFAAALSAA